MDKTNYSTFTLVDGKTNGRLKVKVSTGSGHYLEIQPKGYGDNTSKDGHGIPVILELYNGKLSLRVWGDINQEDHTAAISLEGAREKKRKAE